MSRRAKPDARVPMVAVGASAGGLEAIAKFLAAAPKDSKLAFLVVVHLDPHHESRLPELLQRHTSLPTSVMKDGAVVTPGTVMVCPPSRIPSVVNGRIELTETAGGGSPNLPIDTLFRSVAIDCGEHCVGVVLSGTGSDGTRGIIAIKGEGGLVLVQDEATAAFSGMPQSAAETGLADAVGTPEELAGHLSAVGDHRSRLAPTATDAPQLSELGQIMDVLRRQTGHDFTPYKATTLARRIERRMAVTRTATVAEYAALMQRSPDEAQVLFGELLIGVTSFFRDSEAFAALGRSALPELVASLDGGAKVRVWVPACSTGEEVYSLAMVLTETLDAVGSDVGIQIFGTDLNQNAIDRARAGIYPAGIESDIDGRRLERFFQRDDHGFRVRRELREQVVFSVHDVLRDPPFSRLHLVSCRNLLIYLGADAQRRLLPLLHYTLVDGGLLFLGPSESIAGSSTLFAPVVPKWKIYRRRDSESSGAVDYVFPTGNRFASMATRIGGAPPEDANGSGQITALARDLLLRQATPTAVVVSSEGRVVFIHGRTGRYLEPPEGRMSDNLVELAREGLRLELASALRHAATSKTTVSRTGIRVMVDDLVTWTDVVVEPAEGPSPLSDALLVILRPGISPVAVEGDATATSDGRIPALERELQRSRDSQHAVVEQLQASNEELKALNEEMQSSFEELQSTNEELESTKEEQQSLNEELVTVNAELQAKLDELSRIQDDMANLLDGIRVATLFLNADLSIKRFTPEAAEVVNLIKGDVGRPLAHTVSRLRDRDLSRDAAEVLRSLAILEREVQRDDGRWYLERVMPYRTLENVIDGVVMTFTDIDVQKRFQAELEAARRVFEEVLDLSRDPIAVLDDELRVRSANPAFLASFGDAGRSCVGRPVTEQTAFADRMRELEDFVAACRAGGDQTPTLAIDGVAGGDDVGPWRLTARALRLSPHDDLRILVAVARDDPTVPGLLPEGGGMT